MLRVHILDRCPYCDGQAYLPAGEATNWKGKTYNRFVHCQMCDGTGERGKWVSLPDFMAMLKAAQCHHEHTSHRGGMHFSGGKGRVNLASPMSALPQWIPAGDLLSLRVM